MTAVPDKLLFTLREAAKMISLNEKYFRREVKAGNIPCRLIGPNRDLVRFAIDDLRAYMEERRAAWGSTAEQIPPSGGAPSSSSDVDFDEALKQTTSRQPKPAPRKLRLKPERGLRLVHGTS